jgi:mannitol/fructose-specific phosphotransferase system IIA component (Ntr-type)
MGVSPKGVTFGGPGGRLTRIVFFIVIPTAASAFYLKLLAGLTTAFVEAEARRELAAEADREQLWKTLCRLTRSAIK